MTIMSVKCTDLYSPPFLSLLLLFVCSSFSHLSISISLLLLFAGGAIF